MMHLFNTNIAAKYGVFSAILLQNIFYWVEKNKANNTNCYDGKYWTFNSNKAMQQLFPYMTEKQIRYALDTLKENELIETGFHGGCNRTLSYTITEKGYQVLNNIETDEKQAEESSDKFLPPEKETTTENIPSKSAPTAIEEEKDKESPVPFAKIDNIHLPKSTVSICHTGQMDSPSRANEQNKKQQNINTNNIKKEIHKEKKPPDNVCEEVFMHWNSKKEFIPEPELTQELKTVILTALKSFTLEELKLYIDRYETVLTKSFFSHHWKLVKFLTLKNAIYAFKDDGDRWQDYLLREKRQKSADKFIKHNYTAEHIASLMTNLDEVEV